MGTDLLAQVLECFAQQVPGVRFCRGYGPGWGTRLLTEPLVSGEVASQEREGESRETVLRFTLFPLEEAQGEQLLAQLWDLLPQRFPGCLRLEREPGAADSLTQLRKLAFRAVFGGGEDGQGLALVLGGKSCRASGATVKAAFSGKPLTAVGEESPFALEGAQGEYQVELRGLRTQGLERLASFTAQVGDREYTGCRWSRLELPQGTAVFTASGCKEKEE